MGTSGAGTASGEVPEGVTDLSRGSWIDALKRTVKAFKEDKLGVWAAALTYFGVLSIFPALLVVVSVLGLIGESVTDSLIKNLEDVAPGPAQEIVTDAIRNFQGAGSASGIAFVIGLAGAIWASSGYVSGFMDASNAIYDVEERTFRPCKARWDARELEPSSPSRPRAPQLGDQPPRRVLDCLAQQRRVLLAHSRPRQRLRGLPFSIISSSWSVAPTASQD